MASSHTWRVTSVVLAGMLVLASGTGALAAKEKVDEYELTIINLTPGQPMGGSVWTIHRKKSNNLFATGKPASEALGAFAAAQWIDALIDGANSKKSRKQGFLAAGGVGGDMVDNGFAGHDVARDDRIVAGGVEGAVVAPSYLRSPLRLGPRTKGFVTVVVGLPCLNDGFAAVQDLRLPAKKGQYAVANLVAYDAGVEANTEDFDDLPPHCTSWLGVGEGLGTLGPTGASDEAEGLIVEHAGVQGSGDLDPVANGWDGPIGIVLIKNLGRKTFNFPD